MRFLENNAQVKQAEKSAQVHSNIHSNIPSKNQLNPFSSCGGVCVEHGERKKETDIRMNAYTPLISSKWIKNLCVFHS